MYSTSIQKGEVALEWTTRLFQTVDRMDADGFASFLCENAMFRFGNAEPVIGRGKIKDAVAGFFASIKGLRHHILATWKIDGNVVIQGEATYTRKDDRLVTIPFVNIFKMDGTFVREYLVYVDISPVYS